MYLQQKQGRESWVNKGLTVSIASSGAGILALAAGTSSWKAGRDSDVCDEGCLGWMMDDRARTRNLLLVFWWLVTNLETLCQVLSL
ncbi:hypothetical protein QTJ16_000871 [Diplocarpon rosae]|uniref:Uncharacterized protein n=1 Tax=Diplocarpon rosae TaxID=946125 RepID=A0AAD9T5P7_9HELO|nr:hypothetical protein QTJ16_000871 [Diplocarpon rosae]